MSLSPTAWRTLEALTVALLLFVPLALAAVTGFAQGGFPGPYTQSDAVVVFFVTVPVAFAALATYRVAQFHNLIGVEEDRA